jgi:hypothetical protein
MVRAVGATIVKMKGFFNETKNQFAEMRRLLSAESCNLGGQNRLDAQYHLSAEQHYGEPHRDQRQT